MRRLHRSGVATVTNTMHRSAPAIQDAVKMPLLHIADPTAERIKAAGFQKVGLLDTSFTIEHDFYKGSWPSDMA